MALAKSHLQYPSASFVALCTITLHAESVASGTPHTVVETVLSAANFRTPGLVDISSQIVTTGSPTPNIVDLGYVKYRGNLSYPDTVAYLGLPYAEPPLGERRWRKPETLNTSRISSEAQNRVVNVTEYPNFCVQGTTGGTSDAGTRRHDAYHG